MKSETLERLANIAIVRQRMDLIVNNLRTQRDKSNLIRAKATELDAEFIDLIINAESSKVEMEKADAEMIGAQLRAAKEQLIKAGKLPKPNTIASTVNTIPTSVVAGAVVVDPIAEDEVDDEPVEATTVEASENSIVVKAPEDKEEVKAKPAKRQSKVKRNDH